MASPPHPSRIDVVSPVSARKSVSRRITSPITPGGVTGLVFPSPLESTPSEPLPRPLRRVSRINSYSSVSNGNFVDISSDPPQLADGAALDDLWNSLRLEKERKMNKEPPKVKSLEEYKPSATVDDILNAPSPRPASKLTTSDEKRARVSPAPSAPTARTPEREKRSLLEDALISNDRDSFFRTPSPAPAKAPSPTRRTTSPIVAKTASSSKPSTSSPTPAKTASLKPRTPSPSPAKTPGLKKKKSITVYYPSPEKNYCVAIFRLRGVDKDDIRVTFRRDHIMVSWEMWEVENWEEEDCIARRTVERVYHRVIPLPEGTTFQDVKGTMRGEDLLLQYPLFGIKSAEL